MKTLTTKYELIARTCNWRHGCVYLYARTQERTLTVTVLANGNFNREYTPFSDGLNRLNV